MLTSRSSVWMTSALALGAALFFAVRAQSEPEPATATATSTASANPSASASAALPELPPLKGSMIPQQPSDKPKDAEWATGQKVKPRRDDSARYAGKDRDGLCSFTLVREWLRIQCVNRYGAALMTGEKKDVTIVAPPKFFGEGEEVVVITTRIRRNETQIFTLLGITGLSEFGPYGGFTFDTDEPIAIVWREGREDPYLLVGSL